MNITKFIANDWKQMLGKKPSLEEMDDLDLAEAMNSHDCKQEKCAVCLEWRDRGLKAADFMEDLEDLKNGKF